MNKCLETENDINNIILYIFYCIKINRKVIKETTKSKNKFLFAIARIKSKFDLKKRISSYSYSDIINKVYLLYPNTQNEYNQHESLLFLSLLISGLCNVKIDSLFDDSKDKGAMQQTLELIKQNKIWEDNNNDIEYICDNLNEIFYTNEEIRKLHNENHVEKFFFFSLIFIFIK